jgi:serine/threonine protein kinase
MTDLRESPGLSTGEILDDRYLLRERIGEGGMARVYRAEDAALRRTVAIKVLRGPVGELGSVERARSETRLLAGLNHHSLVTLFDAHISADDASYLVMEFVEGITLRELIARGPVDPGAVASIAIDIAEGLHVAHEAGIVHRDIKPSNVLLWSSPLPGREWRAKLADFGIAYLLDSPRVTSPGIMVGTVAYVAPEQARGITPAPPADVYALGILLIEALTGRRPFGDAEGIGTVVARLSAPPEIPQTLHPSWQGLLRGMTAIRPEDRPTALDVALTVTKLAATEQSGARPVVDEATVAAALPASMPSSPPIVPAPAASPSPTAPTVVAPVEAVAASTGFTRMANQDASTSGVSGGPSRTRRRALVIGAVIGGLLLLAAILGSLWLSGVSASEPTPTPSTPVVEEVVPSETPADPAPPAQEPANQPAENQNGNSNSGPGNNNGNGNGNGNGNSNSGPGNNNGNGNR